MRGIRGAHSKGIWSSLEGRAAERHQRTSISNEKGAKKGMHVKPGNARERQPKTRREGGIKRKKREGSDNCTELKGAT